MPREFKFCGSLVYFVVGVGIRIGYDFTMVSIFASSPWHRVFGYAIDVMLFELIHYLQLSDN